MRRVTVARSRITMLGLSVAALCLAGCSSTEATVSKGLDAPIQAITATDVVVATNLQAVVQAAQVSFATSRSFSGFGPAAAGGTDVTPGASGAAGQISYAVLAGGSGLVLAGWNHADRHCVGLVDLSAGTATPVLGLAGAGQYYFVAPASTSAACSASTFSAESATPSGWPKPPSVSPVAA